MKANIGKTDRILRAALALILLIAGYFYSSWLIFIGGIVLITSFFSWCPIYFPFGWTTHKSKKDIKNS